MSRRIHWYAKKSTIKQPNDTRLIIMTSAIIDHNERLCLRTSSASAVTSCDRMVTVKTMASNTMAVFIQARL